MYIYLNGNFVLEDEAKISPFDHGFLYGLGVFETFRTYNGHPFLLDDHFHRLNHSLEQLNILLPFTKGELRTIIVELLEKNKEQNAYIRLNVSAGVAPVGLRTESYKKPTVIGFIKRLGNSTVIEKNATFLKIPRNTPEGTERLKSHHYLNNIFGKRELTNANDEGIFLTKEGLVAEGIVSNIFWVKDKRVYTPSEETGILNGITRKFIMKLLKDNNIPCETGFFHKEEVFRADEVFITNSIQEIVSIRAIDGMKFNLEPQIAYFLREQYKRCVDNKLWSMYETLERL